MALHRFFDIFGGNKPKYTSMAVFKIHHACEHESMRRWWTFVSRSYITLLWLIVPAFVIDSGCPSGPVFPGGHQETAPGAKVTRLQTAACCVCVRVPMCGCVCAFTRVQSMALCPLLRGLYIASYLLAAPLARRGPHLGGVTSPVKVALFHDTPQGFVARSASRRGADSRQKTSGE